MILFCSSVDYRWYESVSPESPSSPVEQQVYYREPTAGATAPAHYPQYSAALGGPRSTAGMSATSAAQNIYNLNAFPLPNGQERTVGLSSYPVAAQHHHHHLHHPHMKHHSEQSSSTLPHHYHQTATRQSLQYHNYHPQRVNSAVPEKERLRRVSSPEMQMQPPPQRAPRGTRIHSSSNSTHYSKVVLNERGKQVQRRNNGTKYRERPASVGGHGARAERRSDYQRMTVQRSEGSLQYNSLNRGMIFTRDSSSIDPASLSSVQQHQQQQQGGEWAPHQFPPSGSRSEMRSPVFEEMNDPRKAYDSLEGYQSNGFVPGQHHQVNAEEQR